MSEEVPHEPTDDGKGEEFDCPPGRVTVDVQEGAGHQARGIHIYYFDPDVGNTDGLHDAMMLSKKQWNYVKDQVLEWLERNLE